jgi:(p)ppGpp synthase/HD superfamily hydrolase
MEDLQKLTFTMHIVAQWHSWQRRKGAAQEPYVNHLIEVADLVGRLGGGDIEAVQAALLHDAIEDCGKTRDEIAALFGPVVADAVVEVTDDKELHWQTRKDLQVTNASHKSARASLVKLGDKTSNLRSLAASPPLDWDVERRQLYVNWSRSVVAGLPVKPPALLAAFEAAAAEAETRFG